MPSYHLFAEDDGVIACIDLVEACDAEEAIALTTIRLECRDLELRCNGAMIARLARDGRVIRPSLAAVATI